MILFLLSVAAISLSGVMMPGPVLAVTVVKGYKSQTAGVLIALGHGIVEFPLMFLMYYGLMEFFKSALLRTIIGLVGGAVLIYMGIGILRGRSEIIQENEDLSSSEVVAGAITTISNPYFFLWWATVGAALIMRSLSFGSMGFISFTIVHWLCDLGWYSAVSLTVYKTHHLWGGKLQKIIFSLCGLILFGFGAWFILISTPNM